MGLGIRLKHPKLFKLFPDKMVIYYDYYKIFSKLPYLKKPQSFNEKIQWLKLYYHNPKCTQLADKYLAKQYIAKKVGDEYNVPVLAFYNSVDEIDFNALPEEVVVKTNHDSGGVVVKKSNINFDEQKARAKLQKSLNTNFYDMLREWQYKDIKPIVFAESCLYDVNHPNSELMDYKFHYSYGNLFAYYITKDGAHSEDCKLCFFDANDNIIPCQYGVFLDFKKFDNILPNENALNLMKSLGSVLASNFPLCRVDFYYVNNKVYVGELTFTPGSGLNKITPYEYDIMLGSYIALPSKPTR